MRYSKGFLAEWTIAGATAEDARIIAETKTFRNPWKAGQANLTHQTLIQKFNPALAARYKAEAGI